MLKKLKAVLCLAVVGLVLYSGYLFGAAYYRYYGFKSDAEDIIRFHIRGTQEVERLLLERAAEYDIPVHEGNMEVWREENGFAARVAWSETVNVLNLYERKLDFGFEVR